MSPNDPTRIMARNYREIGGSSTIFQLKESIRLSLPDLIFVCETKQSRGFMGTVCKKLKFGSRWVTRDPVSRKGGMLVAWSEHVQVKMMGNNEYNMEMQAVSKHEKERFWVTFVHASIDAKERQ